MASNRIRGITIEIGGDTTRLDKALSETDKQLKTTQTSLKDVERLLKMDPGNTELLAQKQRLLGDAVNETRERLDTMRAAAEQANAQLAAGEISQDQYDALNRELIETEINLRNAERAMEEFNEQSDETEEEAGGLTGALKRLLGASGDAGGGFDVLKVAAGNLVSGGIGLVVGAIKSTISAIWSLDEATEEYREAMGKLNTAFEAAGYSTEVAQQAYRGFFEILGDTDTATEASQLLAKLVDSEEDVAKWTEIAAGVYGTFGDALPIEGLIEAINETSKTAQVTGVLADALNWVGMSEDQVNESLAQLNDESQRAQFLMNNLGLAYSDASEAFYENNEAIIASRNAQADLDESLAKVGESVSEVKTALLDTFGPALATMAEFAAFVFGGIADAIRAVGDVLGWLGDRVKDVTGFFADLFGASGQAASAAPAAGGRARGGAEVYALTAADVPWLASGTVTRPNSPFMAVVGDNPTEPEIIAPYSTIKQAAQDAMAESGGEGLSAARITVNFTGTLAQFVRMMQPEITVETQRLGPQFVK